MLTFSDNRHDRLPGEIDLHPIRTIMTFLFNLWHIVTKAPQIIGIVKAIIDIVGSAQVRHLFESIRDALKTEVSGNDALPPSERERIVRRLLRKIREL